MYRLLPALTIIILASRRSAAQRSTVARRSLDDIVGEWQSDTVAGISARSVCVSSPLGQAVVCEQAITFPSGIRRAINFFVLDSAARGYVYYGLTSPGSAIAPTPLSIENHVWTYGGREPARDGMYYRTVNDFSRRDSYTWRQESSPNGIQWTVVREGRARRV